MRHLDRDADCFAAGVHEIRFLEPVRAPLDLALAPAVRAAGAKERVVVLDAPEATKVGAPAAGPLDGLERLPVVVARPRGAAHGEAGGDGHLEVVCARTARITLRPTGHRRKAARHVQAAA